MIIKMNNWFCAFRKAEGGVAAIEMAFILPLMLLLYFGLLDVTGLVSFNRKISSVASAVGDLVGQNRNTILKTDITDYFHVSSLIMDPTPDSKVTVNVYGFRNTAGTVSQIWKVTNGKGPGCAAITASATMLPLMTAGNDLVVSQACMTYTPYVATFMGTKILGATSFAVKQAVTLRPRASLKLDCYATTVGGAAC